MRLLVILALGLSAVAAGCSAGGCAVDVESASRRGRGVIVGPRAVLTLAHVVGDEENVVVEGSTPARVVARRTRPTETGEDGLVLLELTRGSFPPERVARIAEKAGPGVVYLTAHGEQPWPWRIEPGDSGSPILDADGNVTGLVRAVHGRAEALDHPRLSALTGRDDP